MSKTEYQYKLRIADQHIPFSIEKGKSNRIRLSFTRNNILRIETANGKLGAYEKNFLMDHSNWILKNFRVISSQEQKRQEFLEKLHEQVTILGMQTPIEFCDASRTQYHCKPGIKFQINAPLQAIEHRKKGLVKAALKDYAFSFLREKADSLQGHCNVNYNVLKIKELKSKWGSCSSLRNINLNWQLIYLNEELVEYVIIHELMHLHELNHSKRFWKLVEKHFPEYPAAKKAIKANEWMIGIL